MLPRSGRGYVGFSMISEESIIKSSRIMLRKYIFFWEDSFQNLQNKCVADSWKILIEDQLLWSNEILGESMKNSPGLLRLSQLFSRYLLRDLLRSDMTFLLNLRRSYIIPSWIFGWGLTTRRWLDIDCSVLTGHWLIDVYWTLIARR